MVARTYLDWNASAPLRVEARAALSAALALTGNPSSVHHEGRAARQAVEDARGAVAALVGADARNVIFTAGGTEANALALTPRLDAGRPFDRLLVSAIEHPSVLAGGRFAPGAVENIPVDQNGLVDLGALQRRLEGLGDQRALVSLMAANNETGVVQPVAEAAEIVHRHGGLLHVDAVQAAGRVALDIAALGADLLTLSAHKIGGAKGAGALVKRDEALQIEPLIRGGGQERGSRAGTENVAAVAAFGAAAAAAKAGLAAEQAHMAKLRDRLEAGLRDAAVIFGAAATRLPNTTLAAMPGARAETLVIAFDLDGIAISSGSACSSGKVAPSHVLAAMGMPAELARGAVRISVGAATTETEIDRFLQIWQKLAKSLSSGMKQGLAA
jgi:cysteine desulfurase